ncbi:hypothetical protein BDR06DRAFT_953247 [Suillus hirtellus]|nr:hypothetical protein BDR06DRAFT_953247 [Suillus hirtellus]
MKAFDLASIFIRDSQTIDLLFIKAIALFNANQHKDAMQRVKSWLSLALMYDGYER